MPSLLQSNCATDIHSLSGSMADKQQCRQAGRQTYTFIILSASNFIESFDHISIKHSLNNTKGNGAIVNLYSSLLY